LSSVLGRTAEADGVVTVAAASRLRGVLRLPGDKSISHRALLLATLAAGTSRIAGAGDGDDVRTTARLVAALGADVGRSATPESGRGAATVESGRGAASVDYVVRSPGLAGLVEPDDVLDCGNSGTSLRLLAGILAGRPWSTVLSGDGSLRGRPVGRIVRPLRAMGATVVARRADTVPPLAIRGGAPLHAVDWTTDVPSAQVKSAVLLAGLAADGTTTLAEAVATRDHTERMLRARGVSVSTEAAGADGVRVAIQGGQAVRAIDETVPGDVSAAAFWLVAGAIHPDAELVLDGVGLNPTRTAIVELLARMGADIEVAAGHDRDAARRPESAGEPVGSITVRSSTLRAIDVSPTDVAHAIDEIPILCVAATQAQGTTTIRGAGELRVKESDRVAGIAEGLSAMGARIEVDDDDLRITGPTSLGGAGMTTHGDHRLAMAFAIAGLVGDGVTAIDDAASASISYPGFFDDLERVQA